VLWKALTTRDKMERKPVVRIMPIVVARRRLKSGKQGRGSENGGKATALTTVARRRLYFGSKAAAEIGKARSRLRERWQGDGSEKGSEAAAIFCSKVAASLYNG
jgi:hypothetical protein